MSFTAMGYYQPVGKKDYRCIWCGQTIPKGQKHCKQTGIFEDEFQSNRYHPECFDAAGEDNGYWGDGFTPFENERPIRDASAGQS